MLMDKNWHYLLQAIIAVLLVAATVCSGQDATRVYEVATVHQSPLGAPKASDVILRSLVPRQGKRHPHNTIKAIQDFHGTRLEWTYKLTPEFIEKVKQLGCTVFGAASNHTFDKPLDAWHSRITVCDLDGNPVTATWMRKWNTVYGCMNNPVFREGYVAEVKKYIDAGVMGMQRDDTRGNGGATRWGACFCDHCMNGFRDYLAENSTSQQRRELGITDVTTFSYKQHLKKQGAPVGDAFGKWKGGGQLKSLFIAFQDQQTAAFHRWARKEINTYAKRHAPWSCNNGGQRFTEVNAMFDYMVGELHPPNANPKDLYETVKKAESLKKLQVITLPKSNKYERDIPGLQRITRRIMAWSYACGGLTIVPWDMFMGSRVPRYFGKPEQYADLYGFVRANATFLDGYEEAAIVGKGLQETRYGESLPVTISGGSGEATACVRARPGNSLAPVTIHLTEWADEAKPFTLKLRTACFFGNKPLAIRLNTPPPYDTTAHEQAEQSKDFSALSRTVNLQSTREGEFTVAQIPALDPWGILVVSAKR